MEIERSKITGKEKSAWRKEVKEKVVFKVKKRMTKGVVGSMKCQLVENDKWRRKEYIKETNDKTIKDVIKIKL